MWNEEHSVYIAARDAHTREMEVWMPALFIGSCGIGVATYFTLHALSRRQKKSPPMDGISRATIAMESSLESTEFATKEMQNFNESDEAGFMIHEAPSLV